MILEKYQLQFITHKQKHEPIEVQVEKMCNEGVKWIQYRRKEKVSAKEKHKEVIGIKKITSNYGAMLIINDDIELTKATNADGVHLGKNDASPLLARQVLGLKKIIGGTANTLKDIIHLQNMNVNYIGLGPYKFTSTKKNLSPILGYEGIKSIFDSTEMQNNDIPIIAVGGIEKSDIIPLSQTITSGVAMSSSLLNANNIGSFVNYIYSKFRK